MAKILGKKQKMTQFVSGGAMLGVTPVKVLGDTDFTALKPGILVKVSGTSKGKGFQGVVKRYGFSGGPKTHGQKNRHRAPGSIGNTSPQRVLPGRRMAGRMGGVRITAKNLKLISADPENKTLLILGSIPGNVNGRVEITAST